MRDKIRLKGWYFLGRVGGATITKRKGGQQQWLTGKDFFLPLQGDCVYCIWHPDRFEKVWLK